jgi:hypothetical protein
LSEVQVRSTLSLNMRNAPAVYSDRSGGDQARKGDSSIMDMFSGSSWLAIWPSHVKLVRLRLIALPTFAGAQLALPNLCVRVRTHGYAALGTIPFHRFHD